MNEIFTDSPGHDILPICFLQGCLIPHKLKLSTINSVYKLPNNLRLLSRKENYKEIIAKAKNSESVSSADTKFWQ